MVCCRATQNQRPIKPPSLYFECLIVVFGWLLPYLALT